MPVQARFRWNVKPSEAIGKVSGYAICCGFAHGRAWSTPLFPAAIGDSYREASVFFVPPPPRILDLPMKFVLLSFVCAAGAALAGTIVTDLGSLGGSAAQAFALHAGGEAVGSATNSFGYTHAFSNFG